jgi:hypothetical protein
VRICTCVLGGPRGSWRGANASLGEGKPFLHTLCGYAKCLPRMHYLLEIKNDVHNAHGGAIFAFAYFVGVVKDLSVL